MESLLIFIFAIVISVIISAFFSAAETAITGVSRSHIHKLKLEGSKRAAMVSELREDKDRLISALLLGNNALNIFASALATSSAITLFGNEGVAYATIFMTIVILVFAEVLPKTYAFKNAEKVALAIAPLVKMVVHVLYPFTTLVQYLVTFVMRIFGMRPDSHAPLIPGTEALRGAIELYHYEGAVVKRERDMLGSILDLGAMEVESIMIHRKNMVTMNIDQRPADIIRQMLDNTHTRIPLWQHEPDNIVAVLHIKELIKVLRTHTGSLNDIDIMAIASPPWFIPETTLLSEQLHEFRQKRNHFALVVDEYGALKGVVTLQDILEEIVGQIGEERRQQQHEDDENIKTESEGVYQIGGEVTIRDLNRHFDWTLPDDNASTLAGLIMYVTEKIPEEGEHFELYGFTGEILAKEHNQITLVRLREPMNQ